MAEVAGLVIGAISLASLFDSVINNLDRVQVGREFNETHQRYVLQLEVLKLRLHRWRDAVSKLLDVDDPAVGQANGHLVKRHLSDIQSLFEKEEKLSKPYRVDASDAEEEIEEESKKQWLVKSVQSLSRKHRADTPSVRSKVRWAIRGKKEFEELVANASVQVSNLEQIIPTHEMERRLNQMRSEDANAIGKQREANIKDINLLQEIASVVDQKFADVVKVKAVNEWVGNIAEDEAKLHQGDLVSNDYQGTAIAPGGLWKENVARGNSQVTQGTSYGFNPFAR
ncbi:prion-inhibition and propagation-domain-containing protein [Phaeosphaeriaceae sp. PMI808]|nr:prion-inhibition and propagation-domain-containing protein [Phaeosphaeriaceae sp. PMI808]